jgi:penicillin-insensitive murein endopeptidase
MRPATIWLTAALFTLTGLPVSALAQDTAAQETARRQAILARLPADAAKRWFGLATTPAPGPARSIGDYTKGCVAGAVQLPPDGPTWEVMRPSRNRAWGHPVLIGFLQRIAAMVPSAASWPGLLVGDIGQPRGGPMLTGHASHQVGLDADIWFTPMPPGRLSASERDNISATDVVTAGGADVDPRVWGPQYRLMLETFAKAPEIERIFVNPAIKRALCREAGADRAWLNRVRPWWGHNYHFHIRLTCPRGETECRNQEPPPPGDGCGADLDWWFTRDTKNLPHHEPSIGLRLSEMPGACPAIARATASGS